LDVTPQSYFAPSATPPTAPPPPRRTGWIVALVLISVVVLSLFSCAALGIGLAISGGTAPAVAVIHLEGTISGGRGSSGDATPEQIISQLKRAENDDRVKSVLLRINSPGGTVAASEEIAMEVRRMRKPVVASIGDLGASGAYMVAAECDEIVAAPSSEVGSIGVIAEFPNVAELLKKLGVKFTVLHEGTYKDAGSPFRSLTATETTMVKESLREIYDRFIEQVAAARKLPVAKVRSLATGWVWNGTEAKRLGLVDTLGNYSDGLRVAGRRGGISGEPEVVTYEEAGFGQVLGALTGLSSKLRGFSAEELRDSPVPQAR